MSTPEHETSPEVSPHNMLEHMQITLAETQALYYVAHTLIGLKELPELLQAVVDTIARVLPANRVTLITLDLEARQVIHFVKGGIGIHDVVEVSFDELWDGLLGWTLREMQPSLSSKGIPDPRESIEVQQRRMKTHAGSIIVVPLCYRGNILGAITAINRPEEQEFTQRDVDLMMTIANQSAAAVENARLYNSLQSTNRELERRVIERTAELAEANAQLQTEITEHKRVAQALRTSEARYRMLVETMNDGLVVIDQNTNMTYVNQRFCELLGYTTDELIGQPLPSLLDIANRAIFQEQVARRRQGIQSSYEIAWRTKDHRRMFTLVSGTPLLSDSGEFQGSFAVVTDITERQQAEEDQLAHLRFFESMNKVNQAIQGTNNLEQMMRDVLDTLLDILNCDRAWLVYPCDPNAVSWQVPVECTRSEYRGGFTLGTEMPMDAEVARVIHILQAAGGPVVFGADAAHPVPTEVAQAFQVQSFIAMCLYPKVDKPYMFGLHQCSYPRVWTSEDIRLFQEVGRRLSDALNSLLTYRALQNREQELQQSNNLLQTLIRAAPTAIIGLDLDGNVQLVWNPAAEKMLGWRAEEVMGRLLPSVQKENHEEFQRFRERIRRGETLEGVEVQRQRRDGSLIDYSIYAAPMWDSEGQVIGYIAVLVDITERKQSEAALQHYNRRLAILRDIDRRILVALSPEAVVGAVLEHLVQLIPCEWASIVLYNHDITEERVFMWRHTLDMNIQYGESQPVVSNEVLEHLKSGKSVVTGDLGKQQGDRAHLANDLLAHGLHSAMANPLIAHGRLLGVLAFAAAETDFFTIEHQQIAEEIGAQVAIALHQAELDNQIARHNVELEKRVRERTIQLESANRELELFTYSVSHDLRAPLRAIQGFAEIIARRHSSRLNEEGQRYFGHIITASDQMNHLIDDLLDYARLGRHRLRFEAVLLEDILSEVTSGFTPQTDELGAQIHLLDTSAVVLADRALLKRIFINLLQNALTYHRPGVPPVVKINYSVEFPYVIICVIDNGIGIPVEFHEKVFHIFQRLHTQEQYPGTGIGLAIVRRSVELLNGEVWLETPANGGSIFCIKLPHPSYEDRLP